MNSSTTTKSKEAEPPDEALQTPRRGWAGVAVVGPLTKELGSTTGRLVVSSCWMLKNLQV